MSTSFSLSFVSPTRRTTLADPSLFLLRFGVQSGPATTGNAPKPSSVTEEPSLVFNSPILRSSVGAMMERFGFGTLGLGRSKGQPKFSTLNQFPISRYFLACFFFFSFSPSCFVPFPFVLHPRCFRSSPFVLSSFSLSSSLCMFLSSSATLITINSLSAFTSLLPFASFPHHISTFTTSTTHLLVSRLPFDRSIRLYVTISFSVLLLRLTISPSLHCRRLGKESVGEKERLRRLHSTRLFFIFV